MMSRITKFSIISFCLVLAFVQIGMAEVTAQEAAKLRTTLTPMGAEKAGNAEGTIPAWDGGYTTVPPGYKPGDIRPDFFAEEKPLYSITAQNMEQYADKLCDGQKALLKKYPTFRMDVFPAHRTASAPQFVYDETFKNATRAKLSNNGLKVDGAYNGIPFPIPKNGNELMWNHLLAWRGTETNIQIVNFLVTSAGKLVVVVKGIDQEAFPYYRNDVPYEEWNGDFWRLHQIQKSPAYKAGETLLIHDPVDIYGKGRQTWQYLVGQRRVRRAPQVAYDTPDFVSSGHNYFDEVYVFNGALDRYDWKMIGKKEMIIPYNTNKFHQQELEVVATEKHLNPDYLRWELHRCWVVEANLAEGKRHVVPRRVLYLDEDTWRAHLSDGWDGQGQLWRFNMAVPLLAPDFPGSIVQPMVLYNLQTEAYGGNNLMNGMQSQLESVAPRPDNFYSSSALAGHGVR